MHPTLNLVIVLGLILGALAALLFFGLWMARRFSRKTPASRLSRRLSLTDAISLGLLVLALVAIAAVRQLAPETSLGALLNTPTGLIAAVIGIWLLGTAAHVAIVMLGHWSRKRHGA